MHKTIFIDWDGTLSLSRFWEHLPDAQYQQIQKAFFSEPENVNRWMCGQFSAEEYVKAFNTTKLDDNLLIKELITSTRNMFVEPKAIELIQLIRKKGLSIVIATDNMDTLERWTIPALKLEKHIDGVLSSHAIGVLKCEPGFFDDYLTQNNLKPEQCVLIDDGERNRVVTDFGLGYVKIEKGKLIPELERILKTYMKFKRDILMLDFETTDGRPPLALPIQLAAVLLDKDTLEEKKEFSSYIHQDLKDADPRASQVHGITAEQLKDAPSQNEVMQKFLDEFGTDVFLSTWTTALDMRMLENMMAAIGHDFMEYNYHFLDIWPLAYVHCVKQGKGELFNSVKIFEEFGLPSRGNHDALEDCRHTAEVLRRIVFEGEQSR